MNLHNMAVGLVGIVNANRDVTHRSCTGETQNDHYERVPIYSDSTIKAQVQALSSEQLSVVNNLNFQGEMYSIITAKQLKALSRIDQSGGDLIVFDESTWLVIHIDETFSDHTKAIIQRQL